MRRSRDKPEWHFENELLYLNRTQMLFGGATSVIGEVVDEPSKMPVKEVALR